MPWMDTFLKPVPWYLIPYFSNVRLFNVVFWALEDLELAGFEWLTMIEVIIIIIQAIVINNMFNISQLYHFYIRNKSLPMVSKIKKKAISFLHYNKAYHLLQKKSS